MNILIFNEFYTPYIVGGAEISTQMLAEALVSLGHKVTVCTTCNRDYKKVVNGVDVIYVKIENIYWPYKTSRKKALARFTWHTLDIKNIRYSKRFNEIIGEVKPDIVHSNNICGFSCFVWSSAAKKRIPIVHTIRDYYLMCTKVSMYREEECKKQCGRCKIFSLLKLKASRKVDAVIGISSFILKRHVEHGYFQYTKYKKVISNPIKVSEISNEHKTRTYNIGYIGSLSDAKGVGLLVKVFNKIGNKKYKLLLAGKGDNQYRLKLESMAFNCNIRLLGFVNPDDFYKKIDLLVVPSQWKEPFGRVVIEAISKGIPVIASCNGGLPEILEGRKEGKVFDNAESLEKLLREYMDGISNFDFSDIKSFRDKYSVLNIAKQYENVYYDLTN